MTHPASLNSLWGRLIAEELARLGVAHACIAPGSRSTPLVAALARHPGLQTHVVTDERSAAFLALGIGRATGRPACLVTTSGTAMAHAFPAVLEAEADAVPLLLMSADRPPELRATGANQTLDQVHLFGGHVRWHVDLPCPDVAVPPAFLLSTLDQAVHRSLGPPAGPVHINAMLREPLGPVPVEVADPSLATWLASGRPWTRYHRPSLQPDAEAMRDLTAVVANARQGLLVVGGLRDASEQAAVRTLAGWLGWPVLADVTSGLRGDPSVPGLVPMFDMLLLSAALRQTEAPDTVVQVGGAVTSKRLGQWLAATRPEAHVVVRADSERRDPLHTVTLRLICGLPELVSALPQRAVGSSARVLRLQAASVRLEALVDELLASQDNANDIATARTLARSLPTEQVLMCASSMAIRDLDMFTPGTGGPRTVVANRGASGIDGLIATATGCAVGASRPVTLLLGDQACLHDVGSLALLGRSRAPVTIVLVDNDGGGIFQFLDIAAQTDVFERFYAAPHGTDFAAACAAWGVSYQAVDGTHLLEVLHESWRSPSPRLLHVRTDRRADHALHLTLHARIRESLEATWPT